MSENITCPECDCNDLTQLKEELFKCNKCGHEFDFTRTLCIKDYNLKMSEFENCSFAFSIFKDVDFFGSDMSNCNLKGVNLKGAKISIEMKDKIRWEY